MDDLVLSLAPTVEKLARYIHSSLPSHIELDDIRSVGWVGAIEATRRYSPKRNASLKTFAERRIRGAILDYQRSLDPLSRGHRLAIKMDDSRIMEGLTYSLDQGNIDGGELLVPDSSEDIVRKLSISELFRRSRLGVRRSSIVRDYYLREMDQEAIATKHGISPGRVSQLIASGLARMRRVAPRLKIAPPGGDTTSTCEYCRVQFIHWVTRPRKFCSDACHGKSIPHPPGKMPDGRELSRLYLQEGLSTRRIAVLLGLKSHTNVVAALARHGIKSRPNFQRARTTPDIGKILKLRKAGSTYVEIAATFGVKPGAIEQALCRYRKKLRSLTNNQ